MFEDSCDRLERLRCFSDIPIELVLRGEDFRDLGVLDITEPLLDAGAQIVAVKIIESYDGFTDDDVQKAMILTDEAKADYTVIPVSEENFNFVVNLLNCFFRSAAAYAKKVVLEPSKDVLPRLSKLVSEFLGGVFKYSISPTPHLATSDVLRLSLTHLGQLAAVKLVSFTKSGRATRITSAADLNVFTIVRELVERGYDGFFVIDYEPRGLVLPPQLVREDYNLLQQFVRSIVEKSRRAI